MSNSIISDVESFTTVLQNIEKAKVAIRNLKKNEIFNELKRQNTELKRLVSIRNDFEQKIMSYLEDVKQPGIKYNDYIIFSSEKKASLKLNTEEKKQRMLQFLNDCGLDDSIVNEKLNELNLLDKELKPILKVKKSESKFRQIN